VSNLGNLYLDLGAVDQTFSGSFASATNLYVRGANAGGGTQIFNGSASLNQLIVGYQTGNTNGNLKLSSGSLTVSGNTYVGGGPTLSASENVNGTLTVSGGSLTLNGSEFDLGQSVNGTTPVALFTQTGGTVLDNAGWTGIANGGGISQMDLSGGTFTMSPSAQYPGLNLGIRGNATLNLSGSAQLITPSLLLMHSAAGSGKFATVNLNGGILTVGYVATGNPGSLSTFNFNGGTLRASLSSNAFLQGLSGANVQDGGAVIDSSGYNITINQGLLDSGNGGLTKLGAGTLVLNATNTYSGPTVVAGGTLALGAAGTLAMSSLLDVQTNTILDASLLSNALVVPASQTLRGDGSVWGRIVVNGVLAPGETGLGNLSFNTNVDLAGLTIVKIVKGGTSTSNDMVHASGNLLQGGALLVTNLGPALVAGDSFTLFSATTRSGAFTNLVLPLVGPGLYWDTATLTTNGTLRVAAIPRPQITASLTPGNMVIQVASIAGRTYVLERATNLAAPTFWAAQTSNSGNGGVLTLTAPIMGTSASAFYRLRVN
jgi:autotransporter-associated beta strand protein